MDKFKVRYFAHRVLRPGDIFEDRIGVVWMTIEKNPDEMRAICLRPTPRSPSLREGDRFTLAAVQQPFTLLTTLATILPDEDEDSQEDVL